MLICHEKKVVICTPPRCGSLWIHANVSGMVVVGPQCASKPGDAFYIGTHTTIVPELAAGCERVMVVRDPYRRQVSLWAWECKFLLEQGHGCRPFEEYCRWVAAQPPGFHSMSLLDYARKFKPDRLIWLDDIEEELTGMGLTFKSAPRLNSVIDTTHQKLSAESPIWTRILKDDEFLKKHANAGGHQPNRPI